MDFINKYFYMVSRGLWLLLKPLSIGVRVLMVKEDQVLLVKHVYQDEWFLPGGLVEQGESLQAAARRETSEEVGADLRDIALFGIYSHREYRKIDHVVVFLSRDFSLNGDSDDEIEQCAFFNLQQLPADISPGSKQQIEHYLNGDSPQYEMI
ncbi:MAG: NUDIX domain-containing protein [Anaerolineae bacterium]|nr:NUDIX domain-containing protein [Anaerolineae bacterium]